MTLTQCLETLFWQELHPLAFISKKNFSNMTEQWITPRVILFNQQNCLKLKKVFHKSQHPVLVKIIIVIIIDIGYIVYSKIIKKFYFFTSIKWGSGNESLNMHINNLDKETSRDSRKITHHLIARKPWKGMAKEIKKLIVDYFHRMYFYIN